MATRFALPTLMPRISATRVSFAGTPLRPAAAVSPEAVPQVRVRQRQPVRELLVGHAGAVAALDLLEVGDVVALLLEPRRHLAGVAGVDAGVAGREVEEDRRVALAPPAPLGRAG